MAEQREMCESHGIDLYKFEQEGAELSGHLLKLGKTKMTDKETGEEKEVQGGIIVSEDGVPYKVTFGYQLAQKIRDKFIGHFIVIRFETTKQIGNGKNPMQVFKVTYSKTREMDDNAIAAKLEDVGIFQATSDDIPF